VVSRPLGVLVDELRAALADRALTLDAAAQTEDLEALISIENLARVGQAEVIVEAVSNDATVTEYGKPMRSWLIEDQLLDPAEATRRMRLAQGLPTAPATREALLADRISVAHALVILKVLPYVTDPDLRAQVENALVELSTEEPPYLVARRVDELLAALGVESGKDAHERRYGQRGVGLDETFGGTGSLHGTLTAEVREKLQLVFDAAGQPVGPEDTRSKAQRYHDVLGEVCDFFLSHAETLSPVCSERPRVNVTIPLDVLLEQAKDAWFTATLGSGVSIGPDIARRLACDAGFLPVVLGGRSEIVDIGQATSAFTVAIRRAALLRDGGRCAFPRCRRGVVDLHHIVWFSRGGRTSLDNAAWLCAFHHWLVHEGGWELRRHGDGRYIWTSPDGGQHSLPPPRHPRAA
jgi:hypothetical protein